MLVDGMREDARGITATFHCLQGHREKAEADSSWGCTMKGQEAKATSFSNGNPNWILGICFFFSPITVFTYRNRSPARDEQNCRPCRFPKNFDLSLSLVLL